MNMSDPIGGENLNPNNQDGAELDDAGLAALEADILAMDENSMKDEAQRAKALDALNKAKSIIHQKQIWRERAVKLGHGKTEPAPVADPTKKPESPTTQTDKFKEERFDFRIDHPELPKPVVEEVEKYARANNMTLEDAIKSPIVKKYIDEKKTKDELLAASPSSRQRSNSSAGQIDWATATPEQVRAHRKEIIQRGSTR